MTLFQQYKDSLKQVEAEEILDLIIYRPVAFLLVKISYPLNITPNQVSVIALFFGILSGIFFGFGIYEYTLLGAFSYLICNILDCADGQIARLKKNGSKVGRIIDGSIDYIVSTAVYLGIAIGLTHAANEGYFTSQLFTQFTSASLVTYIWIITVLGGFSSAFQAIYFDYYRNEYLEIVYGKFSSIEEEISEFKDEQNVLEKNKKFSNFLDRILISIYLKYCRLQLNLKSKQAEKTPVVQNIVSVKYKEKHKYFLTLCSFMGSTTHMTLCFIFALLNNFELYLWICILPLNILMFILYFLQKHVNTKLLLHSKH